MRNYIGRCVSLGKHVYIEKPLVLVVVGDKKMAVFDGTQPMVDKHLLYPHKLKWQNNFPVPDKAEAERLQIESEESLKVESKA